MARAQYLSAICPPTGICREHGWIGWTDYTPLPVLVAGMLNAPVASFCQPLYRLLGEDTKKWELIALLVAVTVPWSYIGWVVDTRSSALFKDTAAPHRWHGGLPAWSLAIAGHDSDVPRRTSLRPSESCGLF